MSTVVKDLGAATAYGYAVEKGYTGTEEEFAELMADYAEVGQRAEDAADSALESKTAAQTAATTATTKASEAATSAQTATTAAEAAQADADAAALDASQALSAASTATSKATEATTAAATAVSAKDDAVSANTAAQSAKTAAQTAQTGAETAAASVQESAEQITQNAEDITELKEDLSSVGVAVEQGYWAIASGIATNSGYWCRSKGFISKDLTIKISGNVMTYILAYSRLTGSYVGTWDGSGFSTTFVGEAFIKEFVALDWINEYPDYIFKLDFYLNNNPLTPEYVYDRLTVKTVLNDIDAIYGIVEHTDNSASDWMQGYWGIADGIAQSSLTWVMSNGNIGQDVLSIRTTNDYLMYLLAYEGDTYVGTWSLSEFTKTYNPTYGLTDINLHDFRKAYPSYEYRISAQRKVSANLTPSDFAAVTTVHRSRIRSVSDDIAVIYGDVADPNLWEYGLIKEDGTNIILYGNSYKTRVRTAKYLRPVVPITITPTSDYALSVTTYALNGTFESQSAVFQSEPYTLSNPEKLYRIAIKESTETAITPLNIAQYISASICVNAPMERLNAEVASVKAVNHRGFNTIAPENTLPAFELSGKLGFKYVETDVAFTSDGVPVLMHDATINRTARNSDGTALTSDVNIADITYEQALEYDYGIWKGSQYAGTKIPTFEEFIHCCKAYNVHPWIELKQVYTAEQVALLISIIKKYGMEEHVSFISFSATALGFVKTQWDSVELGYNGTVSDANNLKTGKNRVFMIYELGNDCSAAVNAGYQVCFFGINRVGQFPNMNTDAYDSILTDVLFPSQITDATRYGYTG